MQMRELKGIKWIVRDQYKWYSWMLSKATLTPKHGLFPSLLEVIVNKFNKSVLSTACIPAPILGIFRDTAVSQTDMIPALIEPS